MVRRENPDFLSASTLKKDKVINRAGEDLGKIEELMIDLREGRVGYAVLSFGGFLGMGDKLFAIPWQALQLRVHEHAFVLDIDKEVLENAEGFDKDNWPISSREWLSSTYNYYGYQPYWQTGVAGQTEVTAGMPGETEAERIARTEGRVGRESPEFLSADTINGNKVVNTAGDDIGKIEELMIDLQDGRIAYAVLSHGGVLGIGIKLFAIPWQALTLRARDNAFVLDVPKETFDKAEGFDKDNWPLTREELSNTYRYYGYRPYWQAEMERMPEEIEPERMARVEAERQKTAEIQEEEMARVETEKRELAEIPEEETARQERERLEKLRSTQEEKLSRLEEERIKREKQAETERDRLTQLERERIELERQAEAERDRLAQLERELQKARRQEETEKVTRLENELREVQTQEETRRERLTQLERECIEAKRQAEAEKERLAQLERERTEAERRVEAELVGREKPDFLSASTIKTNRVVNTAGEDLGRIEELMIDLEDGRVAYAVLSFGGFLGMSDKLFAIPWQALQLRAHEHAFVLDIPKDVLERAEGFDKGNWPLTREELSKSYTYYGYQPYWQRREVTERTGLPGEAEFERARMEKEREKPLKTAEERMAQQDKERIERMEETETDKEKRERLERERMIAERREHKYQ